MNDSHSKTKVKVLNGKTLIKISENLRAKTWDSVYSCDDPDAAYNALIDEIMDSINSTIPEKIIHRDAWDQKLWLTKGILKSI